MTHSSDWYQDQCVFLLGGTGTLGACFLYKLAVQLPTRKIFVLCRGAIRDAIEKLETMMPQQVDNILNTNKVRFLLGDITKRQLGLKASDLDMLQNEVTVVVNSTGNVCFKTPLREAVQVNSFGHINLFNVLYSFRILRSFLTVSSVSANFFLPPSAIEERLYPLTDDGSEPDPDEHISTILETGSSPYLDRFPVPYMLSKHLAEKAILKRQSVPFNVIIVRPSVFAPAIRDPYPFYGSTTGSLTPHSVLQLMIKSPDCDLESLVGKVDPHAILDEIPVDFAATTCLAHLAMGTKGIVHASAALYVRWTMPDIAIRCHQYTPSNFFEDIPKADLPRSDDLAIFFFRLLEKHFKAWAIECRRSESLSGVGPLRLDMSCHDPEEFLKARFEQISRALQREYRARSQHNS